MILGRLAWVMLIILLGVGLVASSRKKEAALCMGVDVLIDGAGGKIFIDEKEIEQLINTHLPNGNATATPMNAFDLRQLEQVIEREIWIKKANLFFDNNHTLHVAVLERTPVARIIEQEGISYYIDSEMVRLPLNIAERADLPVFTGVPVRNEKNKVLHGQMLSAIKSLAGMIEADSFWRVQAAQIAITPQLEFMIYPAIGNHVIQLGVVANAQTKLDRCKQFYTEVLTKEGINAYREINAKYGGQIVGVRQQASAPVGDPAKAVTVFDAMVKNNRRQAMEQSIAAEEGQGKMVTTLNNNSSNSIETEKPSIIKPNDSARENSKVPKAIMPQKNN